MDKPIIINGPDAVGSVFGETLHGLDHEEVWCLFLNCKNAVIGVDMLSRGTLRETSIDCRTVLRQALLHNASGIILVHNHPSGDPAPSSTDVTFTSDLRLACTLMNIRMLDHIIICDNCFYSFSRELVTEIED